MVFLYLSIYLLNTAVLFPDGFTGNITLWVKMLLPGVNKRVYNLQSKQLIKLFSQVSNTEWMLYFAHHITDIN